MYRAIIKGRVQNVGFRAKAKALADRSALKGSVQNLSDGNVEIILEGPRELLEQFIRDIAAKLPSEAITEVIIQEAEPFRLLGFSIL